MRPIDLPCPPRARSKGPRAPRTPPSRRNATPQQRLLLLGPEPLADAELLSLMLQNSHRVSDRITHAQEAIWHFGGLSALLRSDAGSFSARPGLSPSGWVALQAARELLRRSALEHLQDTDVLSSPALVQEFLGHWLRDRPAECFAGLFVDNRNRVIAALELFRGTLNQTAVYPREVARAALRLNAAAVIFAHNHPSGIAEPSQADRLLTDALRRALAQIDVTVLDHLIVAGNRCVSFAERGWL